MSVPEASPNEEFLNMKKKPNHLHIDSITTRSLSIVDNSGVPRIVLSTDFRGTMSTIEFLDDSGERKLLLEVENEAVRICVPSTDSKPGITVCRDDRCCGVGMGGPLGQGTMVFLGEDSAPKLTGSPFKQGQGYLFLRDRNSESQIFIPEPPPPESSQQ